MKMYGRFASLLLLFAAVVTGQDQACQDASVALLRNMPCSNAVSRIAEATEANRSVTNTGQLEAYCSPDCRALNRQILTACITDGEDFPDTTELYCTVDPDGVSCYDVSVDSPEYETMISTLLPPVTLACIDEIASDNQTECSPGCAMAVQDFVNNVSCCFLKNLELGFQLVQDASIVSLILPCRTDSTGSNCRVIGGDDGGTTDMGSAPTDMGSGTTDMGNGTTVMGNGTTDMGNGTTDMGNGTTDMGNGANRLGMGGIFGCILLIAAVVMSVF